MTLLTEITRQTMDELISKIELEFQAAINARGGPWPMDEVRARCKIVRVHGSDIETLYVDGKPALEIHPIEFGPMVSDGEKYTQQIIRKFRRFPLEADQPVTTGGADNA